MEYIKKKLNKLVKTKSRVSVGTGVTKQLDDLLAGMNRLQCTNSTPKSQVNLVYNFGEHVDLLLTFATVHGSSMRLSKGYSYLSGLKSMDFDTWSGLDHVSNSHNLSLRCNLNLNTPLFILELSDNPIRSFEFFLRDINKWASNNYPLRLGVDIFSVPGVIDLPGLKVLSAVLENRSLKFIFYYKGITDINFLNIPAGPSHDSIECPTGFFKGESKYEMFLNSMIELRNILKDSDANNGKYYKSILTECSSDWCGISASAINKIRKAGMNVYDNSLCQFLFPNNNAYRLGYSLEKGGQFVRYLPITKKFETNEKYILVSNETKLMLDAELTAGLSNINISKCVLPDIKLIDGIPGCGKSTFILENHIPHRDLVLTQTRAALEDIRLRAREKYEDININRLKTDYRTVSSYIINGSDKKYERVFIDEALLMHAGYVGFVASITEASEIILLGDTRQIPYIERSNYNPRWHQVTSYCTPTSNLCVTKRCPIDVCYALAPYYEDRGLSTVNKKVRSIKPTINDGSLYSLRDNPLILTFTQAEKRMLMHTLKKYPFFKIHTIHEAQGLTARHVVLVRIDSRCLKIYNSIPHIIVSMSRHTESFQYITSTPHEDLVTGIIGEIHKVDDITLRTWNNKNLSKSLCQ
jgi:hypothetical protein